MAQIPPGSGLELPPAVEQIRKLRDKRLDLPCLDRRPGSLLWCDRRPDHLIGPHWEADYDQEWP